MVRAKVGHARKVDARVSWSQGSTSDLQIGLVPALVSCGKPLATVLSLVIWITCVSQDAEGAFVASLSHEAGSRAVDAPVPLGHSHPQQSITHFTLPLPLRSLRRRLNVCKSPPHTLYLAPCHVSLQVIPSCPNFIRRLTRSDGAFQLGMRCCILLVFVDRFQVQLQIGF